MNIGIVTAAYNGYGIYIDQWLKAISELKTKPDQVTVALGKDHGLTNEFELFDIYPDLNLKFVHCEDSRPLMGVMRNHAVEATETEWIMYLSVDDVIMPEAIDTFKVLEKDADYICISWLSRATWSKKADVIFHQGKTPQELAQKFRGKGFIVNHSPYRRSFWELTPYMEHDYPNAPFLAGVIKNGGRFVKTDTPCTMYLRRKDSHASKLGRRGKAFIVKSEKSQANRWKNNCRKVIMKYYGDSR